MATPRTSAPAHSIRRVPVARPTVSMLGGFAVAALGFVLGAAPASAAAQDLRTPQRFVRVAEGGAQIRNLPDPKGIAVRSLRGGALLGVHGERDGWLQVEPPEGLEVWVFGEFLKPAGGNGWYEVTGNNVNLRPLPHSQASSFPLELRLNRGERVRLIARQDPTKPLEEDWVHVITPSGIWGWMSPSSTQPLPAGFDGLAAWTTQRAAAMNTPVVSGQPAAEPQPQRAAPAAQGAQAKLDEAHRLMAEESKKPTPNWKRVRQAYQDVLDIDSQSGVAEVAREYIRRVDTSLDLAALSDELAREKMEREAELARLRKELEASTARNDPLWGRYDVRGWLEREKRFGEPERFVLRWGGERIAEIVCENGRYNLEEFSGYELGLMGRLLARPREAATPTPGSRQRPSAGPPLPILDARRLEVISGRSGGR